MLPFDEYIAVMGARLRRLRVASGMSLRQLGLMVGVHYNQLQRIEQGKVNPSIQTLYRISEGLGVDVSELLPEPGSARDENPRP